MKIAVIYNQDLTRVINQFGIQNKEVYNPKTVKRIVDALEHGGHNVRVIDGNMRVIDSLQEFMPRVIEGERMGMVFNMAYGIQGESRYTHLPAMLEMLGIPYIGSTPTGHAMALDKVITKILIQKHNLLTPNFWVFTNAQEDMSSVQYPVIVKPKMEAVSYGLRIVNNEQELEQAVTFVINEFKQQALVEQFIRGREFCVGMIGNDELESFPVLEIDLENNPDAIQSVDDKKQAPRKKICPANISQELADDMVKFSKTAFRALGLRDFSRVDIRMDEDNNIYLLEINSMASLGITGSFVYAAQIAGYDFRALVNKIVDVAAIRYFSDKTLPFESIETKIVPKKTSLKVRIRGFLRSHQERYEKLLSELVNINTYVRNIEGVNALGNVVSQTLSPLGFYQQIIPQVEVGNFIFLSNTMDSKYDILFLSHLDTLTPFKKQISYRETDQRLYGTGIWANKGGILILVSALQALRFVRLLRKCRLGILFTTDCTVYGRSAQTIISQYATSAETVLGLKGSGLDSTIITSRSGAAVYNCQMNLERAENANDVALATSSFSKLLSNWVDLTNQAAGIVVAPSDAEIKSNIADLYARGETFLSVRFNDPKQANKIDHDIKFVAKKFRKKKLQILVEGGVRRPPMLRNDNVDKLWKRIKKNADNLDIRLLEEHRWSSSDICFVNNNKPVIDGIGPVGSDTVRHEEFIYRHSLLDRATLLAMVIYSLSKDQNR
ncbi:MAG: M20/M25/M40 family metallo-hydrolase [Chitinispirillia bacterium]|jgi:D-alanine-D-alanine ligase